MSLASKLGSFGLNHLGSRLAASVTIALAVSLPVLSVLLKGSRIRTKLFGVRGRIGVEVMYCPKCGSQNIETARFCRKCGTNIAFASDSLGAHTEGFAHSGETAHAGGVQQAIDSTMRMAIQSDIQKAIKKISSGLIFLGLAIYFVGRERWGIWLLFPAFVMLGKGISILIANRVARSSAFAPQVTPAPPGQYSMPAPRPVAHEAQRTGELDGNPSLPLPSPPSVTEGTTRIIAPVAKQ